MTKQDKAQKLVGSWLLGCGGMVFVAVALGATGYYYVVYNTSTEILDKAIDLTSRKS